MNKKKFDRQQALESAMLLFWQKGYQATSTRDLQQATSLQPGSLYGTFKNKKMLFLETLDCYVQTMKQDFDDCHHQYSDPLEALRVFSIQALMGRSGQGDPPSNICFLYKSGIELEGTELSDIPNTMMKEIEGWFLQIFVEAANNHQLKNPQSPAHLAKIYQLQLLGWRAYLSLSNDEDFVKQRVDEFFAGL